MKKLLLTAVCGLVAGQLAVAQTPRCGIDRVRAYMIQQHPELLSAMALQRDKTAADGAAADRAAGTARKTAGEVMIPVVFHVVLTQSQFDRIGGTAGIEQRVLSQMEVINEDFNAANADSTGIPAVFRSRFGNAQIRFALAHRKPEGGGYVSTPGYEVKIITGTDTVYNVDGGTRGSTYSCSDAKYNTAKGLPAWDPARYLNVWVVRITDYNSEGILGITMPPSYIVNYGMPTAEKGVVITYGTLGRRRLATDYYYEAPLDKGRTLTHELGHFFELDHVWGLDPGCGTDDDGIADTPPQDDANYFCPQFPKDNCTHTNGGEMFMNYMDYVNDGCMHLFTHDQVQRMQQQIAAGGNSYPLTTHPELTEWPEAVAAVTPGQSLTIAPNPATTQVTVAAGEGWEKLKALSIVDMAGRAVKAVPLQGMRNGALNIDLSGLDKGIYMVLCRFEAETISRKLILQ